MEELRSEVAAAASLEAGTQRVCERLCREVESTALARVYAILPYRELPADVRSFVDELAANTGQSAAILPGTRVLTLVGSFGRDPDWQDRKKSRGHKGIPLVSAAFVDAIPMLARLLRQLGIDLSWFDAPPDTFCRRLLGGVNGIFYAEDATTARDGTGRLVIPAADFVASEKIRTVFGMGGANPDGSVLACIVFTRERVAHSKVEALTPLLTMLKGETFRAVLERRIFD